MGRLLAARAKRILPSFLARLESDVWQHGCALPKTTCGTDVLHAEQRRLLRQLANAVHAHRNRFIILAEFSCAAQTAVLLCIELGDHRDFFVNRPGQGDGDFWATAGADYAGTAVAICDAGFGAGGVGHILDERLKAAFGPGARSILIGIGQA